MKIMKSWKENEEQGHRKKVVLKITYMFSIIEL